MKDTAVSEFFSTHASSAAKFSTAKRFSSSVPPSEPGPGSYRTTGSTLKSNGVVIPQAARFREIRQKESNTPGPAAYRSEVALRPPAKGGVISRSKRDISFCKESSPGPCAYKVEVSSLRPTPSSISKAKREINFTGSEAPGPGHYNVKEHSDFHAPGTFPRSPKRSLSAHPSFGPGPADYSISNPARSPGPASFTRAPKERPSSVSDAPGPGQYTPLYTATSQYGTKCK